MAHLTLQKAICINIHGKTFTQFSTILYRNNITKELNKTQQAHT